MSRITPYLWFERDAEEAVRFYTSLFPNSSIDSVFRLPDGTFLTATFTIFGQKMMALGGGSQQRFNESISLFVDCETQSEVDRYWEKLTEGGSEQPCGWLKDRFGVSWQVIPRALGQALGDPDPAKAQYAMQAMLKMKKIVVADLFASA